MLGSTVLIGRFADMKALVTVVPDGAPMAFPTAVAFLVCGLAFLAHAAGRLRLALLGGMTATAMGLGVLALYFIAEPLGLWDRQYDPGVFAPGVRFDGRMSPNTAACFALVGLMLCELTRIRPRPRVLLGVGSLVMAISFMALYGHVSGLRTTYSWWRYTGMALHTAVGFLAAAGFVYDRHVGLEHLLYIGCFGLLILVVGSRVLFGHSGNLAAAKPSRPVRSAQGRPLARVPAGGSPGWRRQRISVRR